MSVISECGAADVAGKRRGNRSIQIKLAAVPATTSLLYSSQFLFLYLDVSIYYK
jgi:hypothetical protein